MHTVNAMHTLELDSSGVSSCLKVPGLETKDKPRIS